MHVLLLPYSIAVWPHTVFGLLFVGCCYQPVVAEQLMALADAVPRAPTLAVPWAVPETVPLAVP